MPTTASSKFNAWKAENARRAGRNKENVFMERHRRKVVFKTHCRFSPAKWHSGGEFRRFHFSFLAYSGPGRIRRPRTHLPVPILFQYFPDDVPLEMYSYNKCFLHCTVRSD
ncbi:hypothetical protein GWI33_012007 [Rhynchophorus ferrugineus]|uniref:Uncharacterized protein n=1 Tax=Rhynchophorus ferrugineus TaxID=354439 RepID=A0A834ISE3_RHYFE|nr:hypothetical protein GWI33_012007 [Rhynchophorus ferrugineus]